VHWGGRGIGLAAFQSKGCNAIVLGERVLCNEQSCLILQNGGDWMQAGP